MTGVDLASLVVRFGLEEVRRLVTPPRYRFWVSAGGTEQLWDGKKWRKVQPGTLLASLVGPPLREVKNGQDSFLRAVASLPLPEGDADTPREAMTLRASWFVRAMECVGLLVPSRGKEKWREGPAKARQLLVEKEEESGDGASNADLARWLAYRPLSFWLSAAWQRCNPRLDIRRERFGFEAEADNIWTAALCEGLLLVLFNIRRLRFCPHCNALHWDRDSFVCSACKREQDRQRKARKPKTPVSRFRNKVAQNKRRGRLTEDQARAVLDTLDTLHSQGDSEALKAAERLFAAFKNQRTPGRNDGARV